MRVDSRSLILAWKHPMKPHSFHTVEPDFFFIFAICSAWSSTKTLSCRQKINWNFEHPSCMETKISSAAATILENAARVSIAGTASKYPLVIFRIFRSLARKWKMFVGIIPNSYAEWRQRMANRKRNIQMNFYVTENKKRLIDERIKLIASLPHSISFSFGNELKAEICNSSS